MSTSPTPPASGSTAARLLQAAADLLGSEAALARRLDIGPALLARFISGQRELPAELLLRTVDIVLEMRDPAEALLAGTGARGTDDGAGP